MVLNRKTKEGKLAWSKMSEFHRSNFLRKQKERRAATKKAQDAERNANRAADWKKAKAEKQAEYRVQKFENYEHNGNRPAPELKYQRRYHFKISDFARYDWKGEEVAHGVECMKHFQQFEDATDKMIPQFFYQPESPHRTLKDKLFRMCW